MESMNTQNNRIDLLKQLSFIDDKDLNVFNSYIPDHYNEIYSLYSLLDSLDIDYKKIKFLEPKDYTDSFVFLCIFEDPADRDKLEKHLDSTDNRIQFMRKNPYRVYIKDQNNRTNIKFKHA